MHLENGAVTPTCAVISFGIASIAVGAACVALRRQAEPAKHLSLAVTLGSGVFVSQMLNFPVSSVSSAHLIGGALLAWTLGPAIGIITMSVVLLAQAFCLGDGGILSLGANILNMGVLPALVVMLVKSLAFTKSKGGEFAGLALASFIATVAGAGLLVGEVGLFRPEMQSETFGRFAAQMMTTHFFIGVIEAAIACAVLLAVRAFVTQTDEARRAPQFAFGAVALALLALVPFSSELKDGYEAAAHAAGLDAVIESSTGLSRAAHNIQTTLVSFWPSTELLRAGLVTLAFAAALLAVLWAIGRAGKQAKPAAQ